MPRFHRYLTVLLIVVSFAIVGVPGRAQKLIPPPNFKPEWVRDYAPFRIAGNLYYVGTEELACYLITTPAGNILINTGLLGSDTIIRQHVEALGFHFADTRILLTNQVHFDHVGAMAAIKKATGAKIMVDEKDAPVLADGGNSDFIFGGKGFIFQPVRADRLLHDKEMVTLGGMEIQVLRHPGHTKGSCSFLFKVKEESRAYRVLIANMPTLLDETRAGMPTYPNVLKDYAYTLDTMPKIQFDIWLAAHAGQFYLLQKHHPGDVYNPMAFSGRKDYDEELTELRSAYLKRVNQ
jgi:metallo-beta-lactamase class B